jgi:hypothetical protein
VPDGVYFWVAELVDVCGESGELHGYVTALR